MPGRPSNAAGFSLAETMVALFILALVSAAGSGLLMGATASGKQVRDHEADARRLDIAQAFIRNDIAALSERAITPNDGFSRPGNLFGKSVTGGADPFLSFVRTGWINPGNMNPRSDLQAVRYRLDAQQLVRETILRPDHVNATPIARRVLLDGIGRVDTRFQRGGVWSPDWIGDAGQSLHILPDLIEVTIHFETGESLTIVSLTGVRL